MTNLLGACIFGLLFVVLTLITVTRERQVPDLGTIGRGKAARALTVLGVVLVLCAVAVVFLRFDQIALISSQE
ncbi:MULTISPECIES: hypothetical protein [Rhodococcus]|jgi:hypothetical protein|uniref:Uncharacterized protein n=1 Tax=Rhodococcus qingshengii JCM 15477 TaxID=1303681 RepID=A0AB38RG92_RHOSG|nr:MULTISPECIES: hypothetical protein [Rhodococcus]KLN73207.1 hypothetical protein ABM90_03250 [Rhodococcus erythropolis]ARE33026.1 hypothetical protein A0W34_06515 [Rhodococcus sp. BH4]EME25342.1 hypothetical protein G418_01861 [Rhodococcus qingshengii BKS 20-40]KSU71903.1 hypothetical protein AS032_23565 [Rhodococcus qingshengii]KZL34686.1 hypothetical protein A3852_02535 [Rhodococcus qingshengii]